VRLVARRARALTQSALAMVVLRDPDGETLTVAAADGPRATAVAGRRVPLAGSVIAQVMDTGGPLVLEETPAGSSDRASILAAGEMGPLLTVRLATGDRAGAVTVPVLPTLTPATLRGIVEDSGTAIGLAGTEVRA
jgi:hypothetical protein